MRMMTINCLPQAHSFWKHSWFPRPSRAARVLIQLFRSLQRPWNRQKAQLQKFQKHQPRISLHILTPLHTPIRNRLSGSNMLIEIAGVLISHAGLILSILMIIFTGMLISIYFLRSVTNHFFTSLEYFSLG